MNKLKENAVGIALCLGIATPAYFLGKQFSLIGGPVFGILIGIIVGLFLKDQGKFKPGIAYTSKKILQYAVILLGFGLNLSTIYKTGSQSLPVIFSTISTSLIIAFLLQKLLRIPAKIATLIGVGSSICGGSAIAATAPVIEADDDEIAQAISVIFLFNIIAALIFPTIGTMLGMSNEGFGLFAGSAINDTSSVTAAAAAWDGMHPGANALEIATVVKLTRTLAIIPITLALAFYRTKKEISTNSTVSIKKIFPFFVLYFLLASVATTFLSLPGTMTAPLRNLSKLFIIMAMSAIGINTNIGKLIKTGGKPIILGFCCWSAIAMVSLVLQRIIGIW